MRSSKESPFTADKNDSETIFRRLTQRPAVALPTVGLLMLSLAGLVGSTVLHINSWLPLFGAITINVISMYLLYTVVHEALHRTISTCSATNEWLGRIALFILQPLLALSYTRLLHTQHHRFTNTIKDPEFRVEKNTQWASVAKWMGLGITFFPKPAPVARKVIDKKEVLGTLTLSGLLFILCLVYGVLWETFLLWLLPSRVALGLTIYVFSYLPHCTKLSVQHSCRLKDPHKLITIFSICQNYHAVHHIYPAIPFYRYHAVWLARLDYLQDKLPKPSIKTKSNRPPLAPPQMIYQMNGFSLSTQNPQKPF